MKVAIQCIDINTGEIGTFAHFGDFRAVTKVCADCVELLDLCHRTNIVLELF